jgi:hypothetical protein
VAQLFCGYQSSLLWLLFFSPMLKELKGVDKLHSRVEGCWSLQTIEQWVDLGSTEGSA